MDIFCCIIQFIIQALTVITLFFLHYAKDVSIIIMMISILIVICSKLQKPKEVCVVSANFTLLNNRLLKKIDVG
jgi:hypothetical protein